MRKVKVVVALVMAMMVVGSAAWAWDWEDHVKQAPNGKGDALIFPLYAAINGGWETKLWVINTAVDRSVVAKIVFRSRVNSEELLDFFLYLTPTDVWNGVIRVSATNQVEVYSTDDSALAAPGVFASATNPLKVNLASVRCADDTNAIGYVEVFMSAHSTLNGQGDPDGAGPLGAVSLNAPPVPKMALYNAYAAMLTAGASTANLVTDGINVLAGHMEFRNLTLNQNSAMRATMLRDYDGTLGDGTGNAPYNITRETFFGSSESHNSTGEVEAALNANNISLPYSSSNMTIHFLTFPTKLTVLGSSAVPATMCNTGRTVRSPFFNQQSTAAGGWCIPYNGTDYDLSENSKKATGIFSPAPAASTLCAEVNYYTGFAYAEGWSNYVIVPPNNGGITTFNQMITPSDPAEGNYYQVPVIGSAVNLGSTGDGYWMLNSAYTDGRVTDIVTANNPIYYYYQYQDEANTGFLYDADLPTPAEDQERANPDAINHPTRP